MKEAFLEYNMSYEQQHESNIQTISIVFLESILVLMDQKNYISADWSLHISPVACKHPSVWLLAGSVNASLQRSLNSLLLLKLLTNLSVLITQ